MSSDANSEFRGQDANTDDLPQGSDTVDNSYATSGNEAVPVVKDEMEVDQPNNKRDPDSDAALEQDDKEAIDQSNILDGDRTRHAKATGTYKEPGDEEGLPKGVIDGTDGTSAVTQ